MTIFTQLFALFFVVFVVGGIFVHLFLYKNGAFDEGKMRWGRKPRLKTASFAQIATVPTSSAAASLYGRTRTKKKRHMSAHARVCIVYSLSILALFIVLIVLVLGATQF